MLVLPTSTVTCLASFVSAIHSRAAELEHRYRAVSCRKLMVEQNGNLREGVALELTRTEPLYRLIRVHAWDDRWVWIDARQSQQQRWIWSWTLEGRLGPGLGGVHLLDAIERSERLFTRDDQAGLKDVWRDVLTGERQPTI